MTQEQVDDLPVDFTRFPEELQPLVPLIRKWGVADDDVRTGLIESASDEELTSLAGAFESRWDQINSWLDEHGEEADRYEPTVLSASSEAALEAQYELERRHPTADSETGAKRSWLGRLFGR